MVYSTDITGTRTGLCGTPLCSGVVGDVIVYLDTIGRRIPSMSGTLIIPFQAHCTRHAVVSVIVHGQSFRTHLISPA